MNTLKQTHITLKRGETLKLSGEGQKFELFCMRGSAWVTLARDPNDYVVTQGMSLSLRAAKDLVLEGLSDELELDIRLCA